MEWKEAILNHLDRDYTEPIRDTLWGHIYVSGELKRITGSFPFQRLGRIRQLGPAFHVYPGATHTRLSHSFGVFHIAKKMIRKLVCSPGCPELTLSGVKAFLLASLFHDIGHFPYAHSLKELPLEDHEVLSSRLLLSPPLSGLTEKELRVPPSMAAAVIDTSMDAGGSGEINFFRNILSGVLDPDKLDYLNRDAFFCGVPYGMQDIDFVITRIVPHRDAGLGISDQGVNAIENILFSKYLMYKTVYWHKTVRIATAMVKKGVYLSLREKCFSPEDLYGIDDTQFEMLFSGSCSPYRALIEGVTNRQLYKTAAEVPYSPDSRSHSSLTDIGERTEYEGRIAGELSKTLGRKVPAEAVIIDIPEPISFEIDLPIFTENGTVPFRESGSVFSQPVIRDFTGSLRKVRLVLPEDLFAETRAKGIDTERLIR